VLLGVSENLVYQKGIGFCQKWEVKNIFREGGILHSWRWKIRPYGGEKY
jgi:hypothetical protein